MSVQRQGLRIGFRASIITLFVSVVLFVGLSLVYFSFDRVTSIIREQIKDRAGARFLFRSVDRISPKGFAEKFPIFELRCRRQAGEEAHLALCEAWEKIYATFSTADFNRSLRLLEDFLKAYPDDGVARYHAQAIRQRLN